MMENCSRPFLGPVMEETHCIWVTYRKCRYRIRWPMSSWSTDRPRQREAQYRQAGTRYRSVCAASVCRSSSTWQRTRTRSSSTHHSPSCLSREQRKHACNTHIQLRLSGNLSEVPVVLIYLFCKCFVTCFCWIKFVVVVVSCIIASATVFRKTWVFYLKKPNLVGFGAFNGFCVLLVFCGFFGRTVLWKGKMINRRFILNFLREQWLTICIY